MTRIYRHVIRSCGSFQADVCRAEDCGRGDTKEPAVCDPMMLECRAGVCLLGIFWEARHMQS